MKWKGSLCSNIVCAAGCSVLGITWLYRFFEGNGGFAFPAGAAWLIAAVVWTIRTVKELRKRSDDTTNDESYK